jgi:hypothetical protein
VRNVGIGLAATGGVLFLTSGIHVSRAADIHVRDRANAVILPGPRLAALALSILACACIRVPRPVASGILRAIAERKPFRSGREHRNAELLHAAPAHRGEERLGRRGSAMRTLSRRDLLALPAPLALPGCITNTLEYSTRAVYMDPSRAKPGKLPFETGQILLSEAPGPHGILFTLAPNRFFKFTHSRVIVLDEQGEPCVYDMSAEFKPTLATTPPGSLHGGVRRTQLPTTSASTSTSRSSTRRRRRSPAKWPQRCWNRGARRGFRRPLGLRRRQGALLLRVHRGRARSGRRAATAARRAHRKPVAEARARWFGVTTRESLPAAALPRERLVAAFSRWPTRASATAYLEAKRELYRRFTPDQTSATCSSSRGST